MDILNTLNTVTNTANTVYEFATFDWNKKTVLRLAITAAALVGVTVILAKLNSKDQEQDTAVNESDDSIIESDGAIINDETNETKTQEE